MKKVYFTTTGCKSSQADLGNFGQSFEHLGYQPTFILKEANVVVFSSCGYTEQAYRKVVESCTSLSEDMNLDGTFIVTGCAVEIFKSKIHQDIPRADYVLNNQRLIDFLQESGDSQAHSKIPLYKQSNGYGIKVENGCASKCTYCAIPTGRGKLKSFPLERIVDTLKGLSKSSTNFMLLGEDIGAYGLDIGTSLPKLLQKIYSLPGEFQVEIEMLNPWWFLRYKDLSELIGQGVDQQRLVPYFGLPLQSGSDKILKSMRRIYTSTQFEDIVSDLREKVPGIGLGTDILVGFPGETEQDFTETFKVVERTRFDWHSVFAYSDLSGTSANNLTDKVDEDTKEERVRILIAQAIGQQQEKYNLSSLEDLHKFLITNNLRLPIMTNLTNIFGGTQNGTNEI